MSGRAIKFRAWEPLNKQMVYFDGFIPFQVGEKYIEGALGLDNQGKKYLTTMNFDAIELIQFTGKTDTAGHEVYEGDIFSDHIARKARGVVKFGEYINPFNDDGHGGHVGFYVEWHGDGGLNRKDLAYWLKVSRVIGNIYENTELMGVVTKS